MGRFTNVRTNSAEALLRLARTASQISVARMREKSFSQKWFRISERSGIAQESVPVRIAAEGGFLAGAGGGVAGLVLELFNARNQSARLRGRSEVSRMELRKARR